MMANNLEPGRCGACGYGGAALLGSPGWRDPATPTGELRSRLTKPALPDPIRKSNTRNSAQWVHAQMMNWLRKACLCSAALVPVSTMANAQSSSIRFMEPYAVEGLAVGSPVAPDSWQYKRFNCRPSEQYESSIWCTFSETKGGVSKMLTIMHLHDSVVTYVNKELSPAFFTDSEANKEIARLSAQFGGTPHIYKSPNRPGLPGGIIATWGGIELQPLSRKDLAILAQGKSPKQGILVDYLMDFRESARRGLPVFSLRGSGAGYVWIARFDKKGKEKLRFFAADPSQMKRNAVLTTELSQPTNEVGLAIAQAKSEKAKAEAEKAKADAAKAKADAAKAKADAEKAKAEAARETQKAEAETARKIENAEAERAAPTTAPPQQKAAAALPAPAQPQKDQKEAEATPSETPKPTLPPCDTLVVSRPYFVAQCIALGMEAIHHVGLSDARATAQRERDRLKECAADSLVKLWQMAKVSSAGILRSGAISQLMDFRDAMRLECSKAADRMFKNTASQGN